MLLNKYIETNFGGNKSAFARHVGVIPQQVTKWINDKWIIVDGVLYSPRREVDNDNPKQD